MAHNELLYYSLIIFIKFDHRAAQTCLAILIAAQHIFLFVIYCITLQFSLHHFHKADALGNLRISSDNLYHSMLLQHPKDLLLQTLEFLVSCYNPFGTILALCSFRCMRPNNRHLLIAHLDSSQLLLLLSFTVERSVAFLPLVLSLLFLSFFFPHLLFGLHLQIYSPNCTAK